jgi:hypothetical protein
MGEFLRFIRFIVWLAMGAAHTLVVISSTHLITTKDIPIVCTHTHTHTHTREGRREGCVIIIMFVRFGFLFLC